MEEYIHVHQETIDKVNSEMPDEELLYDLAELYKIFGDSTRIRILYVLFEAEMCVGDLAEETERPCFIRLRMITFVQFSTRDLNIYLNKESIYYERGRKKDR